LLFIYAYLSQLDPVNIYIILIKLVQSVRMRVFLGTPGYVLSILSFLLFCLVALISPPQVNAQSATDFYAQPNLNDAHSIYVNATQPNAHRKKWVNHIAIGGYSLAALYLGVVWYANEDLSSFHFFNDSREWKQMDKVGHALGGYHASKWMIDLYKWSGQEKKQALVTGGLAGFLAMSSIEVFDGFGAKWGASIPDVGANLVGSGLAVLNEGLWNEHRLQLKVSYLPSDYARSGAHEDLFGSNPAEWLVKDYNGQTLWLSVRVHAFLPEGKFKEVYPRWLNLAIGYGAEGLIGGYGEEDWDVINAREYRQFYVSFDIDLSNISTRSGFLHALFNVINIIRIPLPAVQIDQKGIKLKAFQ